MKRIAVLGSTKGTVLPEVVHGIRQKNSPAEVVLVVSHKKEALILEKARALNIENQFIESTAEFDKTISKLFQENKIDLIVLIGYMRILSAEFVNEWQNKIINVHPSLLPAFAGMMSREVHESVLKSGVKETGCTVHYVTEELDAGPILLQKKCEVLLNDTVETLKDRVQKLEGEALAEVVLKLNGGLL